MKEDWYDTLDKMENVDIYVSDGANWIRPFTIDYSQKDDYPEYIRIDDAEGDMIADAICRKPGWQEQAQLLLDICNAKFP